MTGTGAATGSPERWFHRRATMYVEAQVLFHLNQVGVWSLLGSGQALTAAQVAQSLRLDPAATDALLDYVHAVDELLERDAGGRYSLSGFGRKVLERYSDLKAEAGRPSINLFDVRVGAYGPVWQNLGRMLSRSGRYGEDFHRDGRYAEDGVFKLAMRFWDSLVGIADELQVGSLLEVGVTTGLLERLGERYPQRRLYGLDRSWTAVERSAASAAARNVKNVRWLKGDYFDPDGWTREVAADPRGMVYSLHFHELIAAGEQRFVDVLRRLRERLPGWTVLAFEQPRLPHADRERLPEPLWLYAQSNVLIHHLIGNGRILTREAWMDLGARAGCPRVTDRPCDYLGYRAFLFQL